jgi:hypothetical protein
MKWSSLASFASASLPRTNSHASKATGKPKDGTSVNVCHLLDSFSGK